METILVALLNGLIYGLLLFMISSGLTLIFGMMGILNFAHASFYMLGAYLAYAVMGQFGFWVGVIFGTLGVALIGLLCERYLLRHVRRFGHVQELLLTFGLFFAFEEVVKLFYGPYAVGYSVPESLRFTAFHIGEVAYPFFRILIGMTAVIMFALIFCLLRFTRIGLVVRAAVLNPSMVQALGYNVSVIFSLMFAVGAGLAGLAGAMGGAYYTTNPNMATELGVIVFVVVVVGGLGSLGGALIASLLIGVLVNAIIYIDVTFGQIFAAIGLVSDEFAQTTMAVPLSSAAGVLPFILMLLVLMFRPQGIAGDERV
ncbi:branched-chain amino acid ABC transporter permease [Brucellaceae bacterium C25G]